MRFYGQSDSENVGKQFCKGTGGQKHMVVCRELKLFVDCILRKFLAVFRNLWLFDGSEGKIIYEQICGEFLKETFMSWPNFLTDVKKVCNLTFILKFLFPLPLS